MVTELDFTSEITDFDFKAGSDTPEGQAAEQWMAEQQAFFKANPQYGQPILYNALNAAVTRINDLPEAAGKNGLQVLAAAKRVVEQHLETFCATYGNPAITH